jgi:hypothetical protein
MESHKAILLLILIVIAVSVIGYFQRKRTELLISDYLCSKGATNIIISSVWFDMDKTTNTYNVEYFNARGKYCLNSCKIRIGFFGNGEIYWKDPI